MPMHNPPHPGLIVKYDILPELKLSVTRAAKALGVTRQALSDVANGRAAISTEMALRLSAAFGSTAEHWLRMQISYDLWQARHNGPPIVVERFWPPEDDDPARLAVDEETTSTAPTTPTTP